jgi:hypothetical protein
MTNPDTPSTEDDQTPENGREPRLGGANREAAQRRIQLRETEEERDRLAARVDTLTRASVTAVVRGGVPFDPEGGERLGRVSLHNPDDFWEFSGVAVADVVDDEGEPDAEKIRAALSALRTAKPYLFGDRGILAGVLGSSGDSPDTNGHSLGETFRQAHRATISS